MMDYIEQMLADIGDGSQLVIRCKCTTSAISFEAYVIDAKGRGYIDAERSSVDLVIGAIDNLADEWLKEQAR